jgi:hypothetical protein
MTQWAFFAVWVVWLLSVAVQSLSRSPGLWTWGVGASLLAVHSYTVWRQVSRLQDQIWSRGSQDDETRQARAPFEAELERLMKSLTPVLLVAVGVFVIVTAVTFALSSVGFSRDVYGFRRSGQPMSEAVFQLMAFPIAHALILGLVLRDVHETPWDVQDLIETDSRQDEPPITLDLESPPREQAPGGHDRSST